MKPACSGPHVDVLDGPLWDQMKDWNPAVEGAARRLPGQRAGAILQALVRIGRAVRVKAEISARDEREDSGAQQGVYEVTLET